MVKIRLARTGAKKRPFYHLVAADSRSPRDGRFIERLGYFNPIAVGGEVRLKVDTARVDHWVARGAQLSGRASKLVAEARELPALVPEVDDSDSVPAEADAVAAEDAGGGDAPAAAGPDDGSDESSEASDASDASDASGEPADKS